MTTETQTKRAPRFDTHIPVKLKAGSETNGGVIVNLARGGARIEGEDGLVIGQQVLLQLLDVKVLARVVWAKGDAAGLAFNSEIPNDVIAIFHQEHSGTIKF